MRLYHFVNREFGLDDLRKRRLKIAIINDLNDPFEFLGPTAQDPAIRQAFLGVKNGLNRSTGILCFSSTWKNPVQWSHYADRHRGLCLGFDISDDLISRVSYRSKRYEPNIRALSNGGEGAQREMLRVLTTKYSHWRYEHEYRCFLRLRDRDKKTGLYFAKFSKALALREVLVGHSSAVTRSELREALSSYTSDVSTFKVRLAFRSFKVVRQRNERLWV